MQKILKAALGVFLVGLIFCADVTKAQSADGSVRIAVGVGLTLFNQANFSNFRCQDTGVYRPGEVTLEFEQTIALSVEARMTPAHAWGVLGGIQFEKERKLDGGSAKLAGFPLPVGASDDKIQVTTLYVSAVYRWQMFYLPFGFNFSSVKFKPAASSTGVYDADGSLGAQLGAGWLLSDHFALELYSWVTGLKLRVTDGTEVTDYGAGTFSNFFVNGKYLF